MKRIQSPRQNHGPARWTRLSVPCLVGSRGGRWCRQWRPMWSQSENQDSSWSDKRSLTWKVRTSLSEQFVKSLCNRVKSASATFLAVSVISSWLLTSQNPWNTGLIFFQKAKFSKTFSARFWRLNLVRIRVMARGFGTGQKWDTMWFTSGSTRRMPKLTRFF